MMSKINPAIAEDAGNDIRIGRIRREDAKNGGARG